MTVWGGDGTLRVGIDVFTDGYDTYTPSINVYVDVYVGSDNYDYGDNQHLQLSGSISQGWDFHNSLPRAPGATQYVGRATIAGQGQNYGGGPTYSFTLQLSGAFNGAAPSVSTTFTLPPRPKRAPTPPGTPWASNVTSSSAQIQWNPPGDWGGGNYTADRLQVATDSGFGGLVYDVTGSGTRTVGGLSPGRTYWMRSAVATDVAWSGWSGTGSFNTGIAVANAPGTPTFSSVTATSMVVGWAASGADGGSAISDYRLQVSTVSNFSTTVHDSAANDRQRTLTGLIPGGKYYARALANNGAGASAWSATGTATLSQFASSAPTVKLIFPNSVQVTLGQPTGASVSEATGYEVQVDDDSAFASPITVSGTGYPSTNITVTGLVPAKPYWVRSRANTAGGWGSWSAATAFTTLSGAKVLLTGQCVNAAVYAAVGGRWVPVKVYKRVGGQWVL